MLVEQTEVCKSVPDYNTSQRDSSDVTYEVWVAEGKPMRLNAASTYTSR